MNTRPDPPIAGDEGVVKYHLEHADRPVTGGARQVVAALNHWRRPVWARRLIGRDPLRYQGLAYGNIGHRMPGGGFLISGTQTGRLARPGISDYAQVLDWDIAANRLVSLGMARPSSEALSHAAIYDAVPACRCVIHVHSASIWLQTGRLGLPTTPRTAAYGTPEIATWVGRLAGRASARAAHAIGMGGHRDGIIVFAWTPLLAVRYLLKLADRAG